MRLITPGAAVLLAMVALSGCGNSADISGEDPSPEPPAEDDRPSSTASAQNTETPEEEIPDQSVNIPEEWITSTSDAWPDSQGFAQHAPVHELTGECLLFDQEPGFFDELAQFRFSGFGSFGRPTTNYGNEPSSEDSYRYLCSMARSDDLSAEDGPSWAPDAQLMVTDSAEHAEQTVEAFLDQPDLPERVHDVQTVDINGAEIHTVEREFPTNPGNGGELEAVFYDQDAGAIVKLRLHSMDEELRADHGGEGVAEDLARLLTEGP